VNTTLPELNNSAAFTSFIPRYTTPGKLSSFSPYFSSAIFVISMGQPISAFATIFVTLKSLIFALMLSAFEMSLTVFLATFSASF
jgi:hypothetical protein